MITETGGSEASRIGRQLRASWKGPAWHGPSLTEVLADVDAATAARAPLAGAHTIWELVRHISLWASVGRRTLEGAPYPKLEPPDDWPRPEGEWKDALAELDREQKALIDAVRAMPVSRLEQPVTDRNGYTFYVLLHGIIQHNLYHAGQIALLKKPAA
jgi:uncharacterized damage-inducible protein DinB